MDRVELRLRCIEAASRVFEGQGVGDHGERRAWITGAVKELAFELLEWADPIADAGEQCKPTP